MSAFVYPDGKIVVTAGSAAIVGIDTAWSTILRRGTLILVGDNIGVVSSDPDGDDPPGDLAANFVQVWPGPSTADPEVGEDYVAVVLGEGAEIQEKLAQLISAISGKGMGLVSSGPPDDTEGRNNDFRYDPATTLLWFKVAGAWEIVNRPAKFDVYDVFANRGDHDAELAGFTFFATDTEQWWVKATDADADWEGPFTFTPPNDAGISIVLDGLGSVFGTGPLLDVPVSFNCIIRRVTLLADGIGSLVLDIWKAPFASFPPTVADSIVAATKPTLSGAAKYQDSSLVGWSTALLDNDVLRINVDSCSGITRATLTLDVERT